jgi:hypothetical protein
VATLCTFTLEEGEVPEGTTVDKITEQVERTSGPIMLDLRLLIDGRLVAAPDRPWVG